MAMGVDGFQLDTVESADVICYAPDHGHKPGGSTTPKLLERLLWLREELKAIRPDLIFSGEEYGDWLFQVFDLPYSRYFMGSGYQVFRYTFPETLENVMVPAYGYDQANKAFMLGLGVDTEIWGLKRSLLDCPELM